MQHTPLLYITKQELTVLKICNKHKIHIYYLFRQGRRHKIISDVYLSISVKLFVVAFICQLLGYNLNININLVIIWLGLNCIYNIFVAWGLYKAAKICKKVISARTRGRRIIALISH